jgi:hypothetical protein
MKCEAAMSSMLLQVFPKYNSRTIEINDPHPNKLTSPYKRSQGLSELEGD